MSQNYKAVYLLIPSAIKDEADRVRRERQCTFKDIFYAGIYALSKSLVIVNRPQEARIVEMMVENKENK